MFQQFTAGGSAPLFDGFNEAGIVLEHAVHGFGYEFASASTGARSEVLQPDFLLR